MRERGTYRVGTVAVVIILIELIAWAIGFAIWYAAVYHTTRFKIEREWVLWGLPVGTLFTILYVVSLAVKNRGLRRYSSSVLLPWMVPGVSNSLSALRFLLLRHGFTFAVIALAGPMFGTRREEVKAKGVDVIVALDVSNSMLAQDLRPNRMEVAKRGLMQLIEQLKTDRLGIVIFAGTAYTQLPITADKSAAKMFLSSIGPGMIATQGTAIGAAIDLARQGFPKESAKGRAIIVISDGESFEDDGEAAATAAATEGIVVNAIGIGRTDGSPIPDIRNGVEVGFKKDKEGNTVMTKLNEDMLKRIAAAGKGDYAQATNSDTGVGAMVDRLRGMDQSEMGTFRYAGHEDRYQYFLAIACLLIFAGLLMGERGPERSLWSTLNA
jgi:Ca-activated chloride channel homolog